MCSYALTCTSTGYTNTLARKRGHINCL